MTSLNQIRLVFSFNIPTSVQNKRSYYVNCCNAIINWPLQYDTLCNELCSLQKSQKHYKHMPTLLLCLYIEYSDYVTGAIQILYNCQNLERSRGVLPRECLVLDWLVWKSISPSNCTIQSSLDCTNKMARLGWTLLKNSLEDNVCTVVEDASKLYYPTKK